MKFGKIVKDGVDNSDNFQYDFNKYGMVVEKTKIGWKGGTDGKDIYTYNDNQVLIQLSTYDSDGDLSDMTTFEYADNLLISQNNYSANGELKSQVKFDYDGNNIVKAETLGPIDAYSYWENKWRGDKIVESISYNGDGGIESKSVFTNDGKLHKLSCDAYEITLTYNDFDDVATYINAAPYDLVGFWVDRSNGIIYCEYEYDSHSNWVKRTLYKTEAKAPYKVTERDIVYFD